jgi:hypothetical protein
MQFHPIFPASSAASFRRAARLGYMEYCVADDFFTMLRV